MEAKQRPTAAEIRRAINEAGTVTAAAQRFGVSRPTLYKWMHDYGIPGRIQRARAA